MTDLLERPKEFGRRVRNTGAKLTPRVRTGPPRALRASSWTRRGAGALLFGWSALTVSVAGATPLSTYLVDVIDSNPEVREQVHSYRQVTQDYEIALAGWRPSLDLNASSVQFSKRSPDTRQQRQDFNTSQADLTLTQNLFRGFETSNQIEQARARITSAAYRLYDTADNIALDAIQAYLNVLTEKRLVSLAEQNVGSHSRILAKIQERNQSGIGRRSDIEQTEGRLAQAEASLIAQQNNLQDELTRLHRLLGRYIDVSSFVEPEVPEVPAGDVEQLLELALATHPAIQSAMKNIEAARFDYLRSKSADLPTIDLQLKERLGNDIDGLDGTTDEASVQLSFRYNFYRGGADRAEQRKRLSVVHENQAFLSRVRRQVLDTLRLAWVANESLHAQLPFLTLHVEKARQTLQLYREEFLLDQRNLIDVLDAEGELNRALIRHAEARFAALAARYRIQEGLGLLFPAVGLAVDLKDDDLIIASLEVRGIDTVELDADRDKDGRDDATDLCDNSTGAVNDYGCAATPKLVLGFTGVDYAPSATDDAVSTLPGGSVTIEVQRLLANDSDPENDTLTLDSFTQGEQGSVVTDADGNLIYTPDPGFVGSDQFEYAISNSRGATATAHVNVTIGSIRTVASAGPDPSLPVLRFDYKKDSLNRESRPVFEEVLEALRDAAGARLEIYAHTDNVGSELYNLRLAGRRAEAIKAMFVEQGIAPDRIDTIAVGESRPVSDNGSEEGRARNRRAELRILR